MEDTNVIIQQATKADLPAIIELMKALTLTTSTAESGRTPQPADFERIFEQIAGDPNRRLFVAQVDGQIVATADLLIAPNISHRGLPWATLENVVVAENMRQRGIGRKLLQHIIDTARQSGCYKICLSSDKRRTEAHNLYQSLGFDQYGLGFRIYF